MHDVRDLRQAPSDLLQAALLGRIAAVSARWVHACVQERKLVPTSEHRWNTILDHRHCLAGVVATLSRVPCDERKQLHELITRHGGAVRPQLTSACTHVVCGVLSGEKVRRALTTANVHIVPTCWVKNSIQKGVREDEALYRPQQVLEAASDSHDMSVLAGYGVNVFQGKNFFVADSPDAVQIKDQILRCGGALTHNPENSCYIISDFALLHEDGGNDNGLDTGVEQAQTSAHTPKLHRSSYWVSECCNFRTSEWSPASLKPRSLLFQPFPRGELAREDKDGQGRTKVICVSGYVGVWRMALKELIKRSGATQANSLTKKCTHLISFSGNTQKHVKALEWGVKVVNHLWLHDSLVTWRWQCETGYERVCGKEVLDNGWWSELSADQWEEKCVLFVDPLLLPESGPVQEKTERARSRGGLLPLPVCDLSPLWPERSSAHASQVAAQVPSSKLLVPQEADVTRDAEACATDSGAREKASCLAGKRSVRTRSKTPELRREADETHARKPRTKGSPQDTCLTVVPTHLALPAKLGTSVNFRSGSERLNSAKPGQQQKIEIEDRHACGDDETNLGCSEVVLLDGCKQDGTRRYSKKALRDSDHDAAGVGAAEGQSRSQHKDEMEGVGGSHSGQDKIAGAASGKGGTPRGTCFQPCSRTPCAEASGTDSMLQGEKRLRRQSSRVKEPCKPWYPGQIQDDEKTPQTNKEVVVVSKKRARAGGWKEDSHARSSKRGRGAQGTCVQEPTTGPQRHDAAQTPQSATGQGTEMVIMVCGTSAQRKHLASAILTLGNATSVSSHVFIAEATHVLAEGLKRTEKLMCACAKGLWVMRPEWVLDSMTSGRWLPEEDYEWTSSQRDHSADTCVSDRDLWLGVPRRSRLLWQDRQLRIFKGKSVLILPGSFPPPEVLQKVIVCGGGHASLIQGDVSPAEVAKEAVSIRATHLILSHRTDVGGCRQFKLALSGTRTKITKGKFITDVVCEQKRPKEADYLPLV